MSTKSYAQKSRSRTFVLVAAEKPAHCVTACTRKKFKFSRIAHINELKYFNCLQTGLRHAVVIRIDNVMLDSSTHCEDIQIDS